MTGYSNAVLSTEFLQQSKLDEFMQVCHRKSGTLRRIRVSDSIGSTPEPRGGSASHPSIASTAIAIELAMAK